MIIDLTKPMMKADAVEKFLGVTSDELKALVNGKALSYYDIAGNIRYDRVEVESLKVNGLPV